jgi:hypothetical protein
MSDEQRQHAPAKTMEDIEAERQRKLAEQRAKNELSALKAAGKRRTEMAYSDPDAVLDSPGNDDVNTGGLHAVNTGDSDAESTPIEPARRRNIPGTKTVPSDMMSTPQFRAYLRENGVTISAEKAVAYVQSVLGYERVGTTYAARKAPLMKLANRLVDRARNTGNAPAMAEERRA